MCSGYNRRWRINRDPRRLCFPIATSAQHGVSLMEKQWRVPYMQPSFLLRHRLPVLHILRCYILYKLSLWYVISWVGNLTEGMFCMVNEIAGVIIFFSWGGVVRRPITGLFYQPRMADDECGAIGGMRNGSGNRSTRRKPVPVPLCPPQIPHDMMRARTRAAAVGSRRLTAWAMARPYIIFVSILCWKYNLYFLIMT
jgi:hypothetical protein